VFVRPIQFQEGLAQRWHKVTREASERT
jgi:hypothetical protein